MKNYSIAKSRRLRSTPYTSRIENQGVTAYTVYNHMLLPAAFGSIEDSYEHLKKDVQIWDVAAERQVEIQGKDSAKLVQLMTCRDLSKSKIGRCYYCPIIDDSGNLVNDPVVLKLAEDKWWISIADSDVIFFAKGLATGYKFDVKIIEPIVDIIAVQGPKSFDLMEKVFGKIIKELKFFGFSYYDFEGTKHLIARSGWSKQGGFEIYVQNTQSGQKLYDYLFEVGKEFNVKPGCPNLIERIESGLLSYGNDFDNNDNPFECGFDQYVSLNSEVNFLGKENLKKVKSDGIQKKLMGIKLDIKEISLSGSLSLKDENGNIIGELRSACYSPHFEKVIGIAMMKKPYCDVLRLSKQTLMATLVRETFAIYPSFSISFNITMNIAIVGATGNVGRKILEVLEKKKLVIDNLYLLASSRSAGSKINFNSQEHEVLDLETFDFSKVKITFFAAGGKISENFAEKAAKHSLVIDNSSFYRMDPDVPLIVPQVNSDHLNNIKKNIIANPNCSTAQLVIALKPLHDLFKIKRIVVSTYQSVSGGGKAPMDELIEQTKQVLQNNKVESKNFTKQIAFNVIPHIDVFADDGYTKEELKMTNETKKILDDKIDLTATCVRLPVLVSHSESVNIEFENPFTLEKVRDALRKF